ncbi:fasciclin domain-containing protein [Verrucomicrobia bacterium]|nr:fasciclin domain-containing protein [Verrucomicrobiota bacterium]
MKLFKRFSLTLIASLSIFAPLLQAANPAEAKTIGRTVREMPELSSFLQLLEKTGIGSILSESTSASYTVFAPIDAAFKKLPKGTVETLLDPRNDDRLEEVFGFHVKETSEAPIFIEKYSLLRMTTRQFLSVNYKDKKIGDARFTGSVIPCSNGVIYLIDKVLTPTTDDLFQRLQKDGRFTIFTKAITASRQGKLFQNMHSLYTTFAPTDEAFKKLPANTLESLFLPENDERLEDIIKHHITEQVYAYGKSSGNRRSLGVSDVTPFSAFGQQLNFKLHGKHATIDGAKITETDIPCANGIIHVIDNVILPSENSLLELIKGEKRFSTLTRLLSETGLDLPLASSRNTLTIFAPVNEAWEKEPYKSLVKNLENSGGEALYGVLARHVIVGKHVSENPKPYNKLRTIHGAPIYLTQGEGKSKISGIRIINSDTEAFNGLVNAIGSVIKDPMELPEKDISTVDAILFVQNSLKEGSELYNKGEYEASWRNYIVRGNEFLTKYSKFASSSQSNKVRAVIFDDQPVAQLAKEAWASRNVFRDLLRELEQREDRIVDSYLMQVPNKSRFGR